MEKHKTVVVSGSDSRRPPTIILRMRNPSTLQRNKPLVQQDYSQGEIEFISEGASHKFKRGIPEWSTNYESYEKVFPDMISRVLRGCDQVYIMGGEDEQRLDTFIGNCNDPGLLLILMVFLLQEKYKLNHNCMTIRVSFVEYSNGLYYDLLNSSHVPLRVITRENKRCLEGHAWIKLAEYIEFLKLLKIALYNNKHRDFRVAKGQPQENHESLFMVQINVEITEQGKPTTQSTMYLVDLQDDRKKEKSNIKTEWDYMCQLLKSLKRDGEGKSQHNTFSEYLEHPINEAATTLVYCMSTVKEKFSINLHRLAQLKDIQTCKRNQGIPIKPALPPDETKTILDLNNKAQELMKSFNNMEYSSYRHLFQMESIVSANIDQISSRVIQATQLISQIILIRAKLNLELGCNLTEEKDLIGSSVKTENIKEFYNAKTYSSLYREVGILTEERSKTIGTLSRQLYQLIDKFEKLKKRQAAFISEMVATGNSDTITRNVVDRVMAIATGIFEAINTREKELYWQHHRVWLEAFSCKSKLHEEAQQFARIFQNMQGMMQKLMSDGNCSFKQQRIISNSNIISKTLSRIHEQQKENMNTHKTTDYSEDLGKKCVLPRLRFKKLTRDKDECRVPMKEAPNKRFTIKLSDFLFRIDRNEEIAQDILHEKPVSTKYN